MEYLVALRFKDNTKALYRIGNVENIEQARLAAASVADRAVLVSVPCYRHPTEPEAA